MSLIFNCIVSRSFHLFVSRVKTTSKGKPAATKSILSAILNPIPSKMQSECGCVMEIFKCASFNKLTLVEKTLDAINTGFIFCGPWGSNCSNIRFNRGTFMRFSPTVKIESKSNPKSIDGILNDFFKKCLKGRDIFNFHRHSRSMCMPAKLF